MKKQLPTCCALLTAMLLLAVAPFSYGQTQPQDKNAVVARVIAECQRLRELPGIDIEWRLDRDNLIPNSAEGYAFPWSETRVVIRPREQGKVFLRLKQPIQYVDVKQKGETVREMSTDTEYFATNTISQTGNTLSSIHSLKREPMDSFGTWALYYRCIGYPVTQRPDEGIAERRAYPNGGFWLPEALTNFGKEYSLLPSQESVDGASCLVLERKEIDKLWVDPAMNYTIRRRQYWWGVGKGLRTDTIMSDFEQVAPGIWLPKKIYHDRYAGPWDPKSMLGKAVNRLSLKVTQLSVTEVPDSIFRLTIPVGARVQDNISNPDLTKPVFFVNQPGADPFDQAITGDYKRQQWYKWMLFIGLSVGSLIMILLLLWRESIRRRASKLGDW